jgi:hypothetical protein
MEPRKPESRPWCHSFYTVYDAWDGYYGLHRQKEKFLKETTYVELNHEDTRDMTTKKTNEKFLLSARRGRRRADNPVPFIIRKM